MDRLQPILDYTVFNFSVTRWAFVLLIVGLTVLLLGTLKRMVLKRLNTWSKLERLSWLNYVEALFEKPKIFLYLAVGLYMGLTLFEIRDEFVSHGYVAAQVLVIVQVGVWTSAVVTVLIDRYKLEVEDDEAQLTALSAVDFLMGLAVWSIVMLMILANLGFDITALIASLGIGGVAIALAAQKILGDLFAFFSIIVDKPFVRNDFINVDDCTGTIEHVGIKSTRVRSLSGEQLIFTNEDLLQSRIRNFKRMEQRRVVFQFGVTFDTDTADLELIPEIVAEILEAEEEVRFDRAHLSEFGESSLRYEVVYWVLSSEFRAHMDIKERLLLSLLDEFGSRNIRIAYPTRTVFLDGDSPRETSDTRSTAGAAA